MTGDTTRALEGLEKRIRIAIMEAECGAWWMPEGIPHGTSVVDVEVAALRVMRAFEAWNRRAPTLVEDCSSRDFAQRGSEPLTVPEASVNAEDFLIRAMRSLDACASEFGLASGYCGEHLDALYRALDQIDPPEPEVGAPTPAAAIRFRMEQGGHTRADLVKLVGSRARAAEILSGKREPSKAHIRRLVDEWGIPARSLLGPAESGAGVCQGSEADTAQGNPAPDEPK
jgi:antitoxin component HigA of HigAB toxin-antitoxin module